MPVSPLVERMMREASNGDSAAPMGAQPPGGADWMSNLVAQLGKGVNVKPGQNGGGGGGFPAPAGGGDIIARIMAAIRKNESGGNYTAKNPDSSASGAYQFINSTWGGYGGYQTAGSAPAHVQDARARQLMTQYYNQWKDPASVAVAWFAGPGAVRPGANYNYHPGGPSSNPTIAHYVQKFLEAFNSIR